MRRCDQARWRRQRGQSLLETAIMLIVIFTVVFWVIELGYFTYTYSILADAANEGVRYSIVHSGGDSSGTQTVVKNFVATSPQSVSSSISTSVSFPDGSATPPNRVRVTVTYTYAPFLSSFVSTTTMKTYAEGRMVVP
jgi:Flp pilus assembly protein TadG